MSTPDELSEDPAPEGERVRGRWVRRLIAATVALCLLGGGVGTAAFTVDGADDATTTVGPGPGPRKVTQNEAYRLSIMRVQNYRVGGAHVRALLPMAGGVIRVDGDVDYRRKIGFAKVTGAGAASGVYQWTQGKVLTWTPKSRAVTRPPKLPEREAVQRRLAPKKYPLDALLARLLTLGAKNRDTRLPRGATYLRVAMLHRTGGVDVIRAARRADGVGATYFLDSRGVLHRVSTQVARRPATIDTDIRAYRKFPRAAELRPAPKR